MSLPKNIPRVQFSELEAASELGMTVEELRTLIRQHIVKSDDDAGNSSLTTFLPSDLLLLRLLAASRAA